MRHLRLIIALMLVLCVSWASTSVSAQLASDAMREIEWNPDNTLLAIARQNGIVEIIDGTNLATLRTIQANTSGPVIDMEWHPSSKVPYLATGGTDGIVQIWDTTNGNNLANLVGSDPEMITGISWNSTGSQIMGFTISGRAILWDWNVTAHAMVFEAPGFTDSPSGAWSVDDGYYAVASSTSVALFEATSPNQGQLFIGLNQHTNVIGAIAWSPNPNTPQILVSVGADQTVRLWDAPAGTLLHTAFITEDPERVSFNPNGSMIAVGDTSNTITVWDVNDLTLVQELETSGTYPTFGWQSNDTITYVNESSELSSWRLLPISESSIPAPP